MPFEVALRRVITPGYVPTEVQFEPGGLGRLPESARELAAAAGARRVMVITGRPSPAKPWLAAALPALRQLPGASWHTGQQPRPTLESVGRLVETARRLGTDFIVAVGGGSVIDAAKVVALLAPLGIGPEEALRGIPEGASPLPLVVATTTAGSGAEVTRTATLWQDVPPTKHSIDHPGLFPRLAIVDPLVAATAPPEAFASAALDALAQGMESLWAVRSTAETRQHAGQAIDLVFGALRRIIADPDDRLAALSDLSMGSLQSGLAIAGSRTTLAHAISYPLTARYGVSHGHACALTLAQVLRFNGEVRAEDCQDPRGVEHVRAMVEEACGHLGVPDPDAAGPVLTELVERLGLPTLGALRHVDLRRLAADVPVGERAANNPRVLDQDGLRTILEQAATPRGLGSRTLPKPTMEGKTWTDLLTSTLTS